MINAKQYPTLAKVLVQADSRGDAKTNYANATANNSLSFIFDEGASRMSQLESWLAKYSDGEGKPDMKGSASAYEVAEHYAEYNVLKAYMAKEEELTIKIRTFFDEISDSVVPT